MRNYSILLVSFFMLGTPSVLVAQDVVSDPAIAESRAEEDNNEFPWGILGLIGLAGLLGMKRNGEHNRSSHSVR